MSKLCQPVQAYRAFAVYASYDGNAPDTDDLATFSNEQAAEDLVAFMATPEGEEFGLCYNEGHEWCKAFLIREVAILKDRTEYVHDTLAEFRAEEEY